MPGAFPVPGNKPRPVSIPASPVTQGVRSAANWLGQQLSRPVARPVASLTGYGAGNPRYGTGSTRNDPRYTASGAPIPGMIGGGNRAGGGNAGASTSVGRSSAPVARSAPAPVAAPQAPVGSGWQPHTSPSSVARSQALTSMAQQYAPQDYWKSETGKALAAAAESGPRAGQAGYAQRADIQAWIDANKNAPAGADGKNAVQRFLEQQRQKGLMDTSDLMAAPMANRSEEIYSGKLLGGDELPGIQATGRTIGANSQSWPEAAMPAERVTAAYGGMDLRPGATEYANAPMSGAAVEAFGAKARSGAPLLQATPATEALARNPQAWPQGGTDSEQITAAFGGRQQEAPQAEPSWLANAIRDDQITSAYGGRQPEAAQPEAAPQAAPATWPANAEDQGRIAAAYGGGMDLQAPGNLTNPQQNRANNLLGNYVSFLKGQF